MLTSGDVVDLDLELPTGYEAGFRHPAVVVTARRILSTLKPGCAHDASGDDATDIDRNGR